MNQNQGDLVGVFDNPNQRAVGPPKKTLPINSGYTNVNTTTNKPSQGMPPQQGNENLGQKDDDDKQELVSESLGKDRMQFKLQTKYKYPASFKQGLAHRRGKKFGQKTKGENSTVLVCSCCDNLIQSQQFPIDYPTFIEEPNRQNKICKLPTGVSMYFTFFKMIIGYLIMRFLIFDIANIILSISGNFCAEYFITHPQDPCQILISGYNLRSAADTASSNLLDMLSLIFTIVSIFYFMRFRTIQYSLRNRFRIMDASEDDFSILIENIPLFIFDQNSEMNIVNFNYERYLKRLLEDSLRKWLGEILRKGDAFESDQLEYQLLKLDYEMIRQKNNNSILKHSFVNNITLLYDFTEIENNLKLKQQLIQQYMVNVDLTEKKAKGKNLSDEQKRLITQDQQEEIAKKLQLLNLESIKLCEYFAKNESLTSSTPSFKLSHFLGKAIVSFQYQHYRDYFLRQYERNSDFIQINGRSIAIHKARKPNDYFFFNLKISELQRAKNIFYSWAVLAMELALSFACLMWMQEWQASQHDKVYGTDYISLLRAYLPIASMAIATNVINFILSYSMDLLSTALQRHKSKSDRLNSLIIKNVVTQTINSSLIYWIIYTRHPSNPLGKYGLVNKVIGLVWLSGLINIGYELTQPVDWVMDKWYSWKYPDNTEKEEVKKDSKENQVEEGEEKIEKINDIPFFQVQYNKVKELKQFDYATNYAFPIVYTFVVAFYGFMVPYATAILVMILVVQYWVDKYNLFKRSSMPIDVSFDFGIMVFRIFEVSVVLYALGYFVWDLAIHFDSSIKFKVINIVNLCLAFAYIGISYFAPLSIRRMVFRDFDEPDCLSYSQKIFPTTYRNQNPASSYLPENKIKKTESQAIPYYFNELDPSHSQLLKQQTKKVAIGEYTDEDINNFKKLSNFYAKTDADAFLFQTVQKMEKLQISEMEKGAERRTDTNYIRTNKLSKNENKSNLGGLNEVNNKEAETKKYNFQEASYIGPRIQKTEKTTLSKIIK